MTRRSTSLFLLLAISLCNLGEAQAIFRQAFFLRESVRGFDAAGNALAGVVPTNGAPASAAHAKQAASVPNRKVRPSASGQLGMSPFQRRIAPWVRDRIRAMRAGRASSASSNSAMPHSATSSSGNDFTPPGFGGYLGPLSSGAAASECTNAAYNCGLEILVTGDLNGDGKPDLVSVQYNGVIYALINNGAGGFAAPVEYDPPMLTDDVTYAVGADFNGDGRMDIALVDQSNNQIDIFLNQGNGTFATPTSIPIVTSDHENLNAIAVGDVNGDGKIDFVALTSITTGGGRFGPNNVQGGSPSTTFTLQTFFGNGDGTFVTPTAAQTTVQTITSGAAVLGANMELADLQGNGTLDLLFPIGETIGGAPNYQKYGAIAPSNGDGTFGAFTTPITGDQFNRPTDTIHAIDLNGDGILDLVLQADQQIYTALGTGNGNFAATINTGFDSEILQFADVNGDGYPDLLSQTSGMEVALGNGDGTFNPPPAVYLSTDTGGIEDSVFGDFNGDGILDIAAITNDPRVIELAQGLGGGVYTAVPALYSPANPAIPSGNLELEAVADFNGDGVSDILSLNLLSPPSLTVALGNGKGGFTYKTALSLSQFPNLQYVQPVTADFNGDGFPDILLTGSVGSLAVALSNGDGTFKTPVNIPLGPLGCTPDLADVADLTGNGHLDIVIAYGGDTGCGEGGNNPSGYFVISGNGDGTFGAAQFYPFGNELYAPTLADLNGDGIPDLMLNDEPMAPGLGRTFAIYFLPGNGDGTFGAPLAVNIGGVVSQVIAADVNGDGIKDLILFNEGNYTGNTSFGDSPGSNAGIDLFMNDGHAVFNPLSQLSAGNYYMNGYVGDVNGDGVADITASLFEVNTQNNAEDGFVTWLGLGQGYFAPVGTPAQRGADLLLPGNFLSDGTTSFAVNLNTEFLPDEGDLAGAPEVFVMFNQGGDTLALTPSATSAAQGAEVNLTAAITTTISRGAPTGTIAFATNGTTLGTATVEGGTASFSTGSLGVGTNSITATYSGDGNYNVASATTSVAVSAIQPGIAVSASPASLTAMPGATVTALISVAANPAFSGAVSLSCTGAPSQSSCTVSPASLQLSAGQSSAVTLVIATTAANNTYQAGNRPAQPNSLHRSGSGMALTAILLFALPWRRRLGNSFLGLLTLAVVCASALIGCGGSKPAPTYTGTAAGSYTLTVTATSGSVSGSSTITLQVQ